MTRTLLIASLALALIGGGIWYAHSAGYRAGVADERLAHQEAAQEAQERIDAVVARNAILARDMAAQAAQRRDNDRRRQDAANALPNADDVCLGPDGVRIILGIN